jgi:peptidoglycan/xylan/chitin deacetylase (PgdA/CDA1 family)
MRIRGIGRLRQAARRLRHRFARGGLILLYHCVAEVRSDPWSLCVTPRHFAEHLEILRKHGRPMRLQQLAQPLQDGNLPHRSIAVTFDDGYADNLHHAKPLLERYDMPATVFLTTGCIGQEREFWWDELDRVLLQPGTLPETLRLSVEGSPYEWDLGEAAHYSEDDYQCHRCWRAWEKVDPSARHFLYRSLYQMLQPLREGERRKVLDQLLEWAGVRPVSRPTHRTLSLEEACSLAQGELIEVGSHTVTHPVLSALSAASQRDEIQRSKTYLEELLGRPLMSFAYPYGGPSHYTVETAAIVREAGFHYACSNFADLAWRATDRFQLPRFMVPNWDGNEFARWLRECFRG